MNTSTRFTLLVEGKFEGHHDSMALALGTASRFTRPWEITRQTCRIGKSICNADFGMPHVDVMESVTVAKGPPPAEPPEGCTRVKVCGRTLDLPHDLARAAGVGDAWSDANAAARAFAEAFGEGLDGVQAAYRAVVILGKHREAEAQRVAQQRAGDAALHAARVQRQAAMLACRARGVSSEIEDR